MKNRKINYSLLLIAFVFLAFVANASDIKIKITKTYLNIPVGKQARMKLIKIYSGNKELREFPVQLAEQKVDYWIFIDVNEFKGKTITLTSYASTAALKRIYQADKIAGADSLYKESNRPQFHFTVKRGWNNDINGPIYYKGTYHLFWQAFPFGNSWYTAYMYWGHATSKDMLHWTETAPALMLDSLGSPWSGTAVIDKNNDGGWGKDAMVLYYTAFDVVSGGKQVQCIAYSTDGGKTFKRYKGNPVIDSNDEMHSNDTRDPKVFYYEPTKTWVMVLFERDGLSFYNSKDMKTWSKQSHFKGLHECPDFFEMAVDGNLANKKWVLHGGSSDYYIGTFDGKEFHPESPRLSYAKGDLYAAESFANMPGDRHVQMAWGRIEHPGMPFNQMMLFPTEFSLNTTKDGLRLYANPIKEIETLHTLIKEFGNATLREANTILKNIKPGPLHIKMSTETKSGQNIRLFYQGNELANFTAQDLPNERNNIEILIDKTVAEIFINNGEQYIVKKLGTPLNDTGLSFQVDANFQQDNPGAFIKKIMIYQMKSVW
jgi:sucrose-6-phosphate hydrolase SacC (GH32 family)